MYVITGYSSWVAGLLVVVEASSLEEAFTKMPTATQKLVVVPDYGTFLCDSAALDSDIKESVESGEIRWFWALAGQEVKLNVQLDGAVCW